PSAQAALPSVGTYISYPSVQGTRLSWDGQKIASVQLIGGNVVLSVQDFSGKALFKRNFNKIRISDLAWVAPDQIVARLVYPEQSVPYRTFYVAVLIDIKAGTAVTLTDNIKNTTAGGVRTIRSRCNETACRIFADINILRSNQVVSERPTDAGQSVSTNEISVGFNPVLYELNTTTNQHRVALTTPKEVADWEIDPSGQYFFALDYGWREGWWRVDLYQNGQKIKTVASGETKYGKPYLPGAGRTAGTVLLQVEPVAGQPAQIFEISAADTPETALRNVVFADASQWNHGIWNPVTGTLVGYARDGQGADRYHFFDDGLGAVWRGLQKAMPGYDMDLVSADQGMTRLLVNVYGIDEADAYYLYDRTTKTFERLADARPMIAPEALAPQSLIQYAAADGTPIEAVLTLPPAAVLKGRDPKSMPLVVMPHGGPLRYAYRAYDGWGQALASKGYAVLEPNVRGSTGYGYDHIRKGRNEWGRKMQSDLSDGVRYLAQQGTIDAARVCIIGSGSAHSGYAALAGITMEPGVYRCAVSYEGISDLPAFDFEYGKRPWDSADTLTNWSGFLGERSGWKAISPSTHAKAASGPVLLMHRKTHADLHIRQSQIMRDALKGAGKPVEYLELDWGTDGPANDAARLKATETMVQFVEKHNPPQ
ncbi:MAG: alpha/beta hydrolase family protein, partial [Asticcacaulis sp.]